MIIRRLSQQDYLSCWQAMQNFTNERTDTSPDEIWLSEHAPVFTQGQSGKSEHILKPGTIPIIQTDRGGQVTYHGPGQLMVYTLINLKRLNLTIRDFVCKLEQSVIQLLADFSITAHAKKEAPGVYIGEEKIASLGLRVRRGYTYHGLALNVDMDLSPFSRIHPCGFESLKMTQFSDHGGLKSVAQTGEKLLTYLQQNLGYTTNNLEANGRTDG